MLLISLVLILLVISAETKHFKPSARIYRGDVAKPNQFPYMVSLREVIKPSRSSYRHYCGAALISNRWILTAAHCCVNVSDVDDIGVFMGTIDNDPRDLKRLVKVKQIIIHEDFNQTIMSNDIALIWTKIRIKFNERIQPVPIAKRWIQPNEEGVFTGFGIIGL